MTLEFLNPSRSFDEVRKAIRFIGHDGMFEVPFFVEVEALDKSSVGLRSMERSQEMYLSTFDSARRSIENVAREAYSHGRQTIRSPAQISGSEIALWGSVTGV